MLIEALAMYIIRDVVTEPREHPLSARQVDEIAEWPVTSRNPTAALQIAEQVSQVALQLISAQAWGDVFVEPSPGKRADDGRQWAQGERERKN